MRKKTWRVFWKDKAKSQTETSAAVFAAVSRLKNLEDLTETFLTFMHVP